MSKNRLTDKQAMFCKHYLANGFVAKHAAISAGFSAKNADKIGSQLLDNPRVRAQIDLNLAKAAKKLDLTFEYKLEKLKRCIELAMTKNEIVNHNALLGAIAEANKMQGHYSAEKRIEIKTDVVKEEVDELLNKYRRNY